MNIPPKIPNEKQKCCKPKKWSKQDDQTLIEAVEQKGPCKWNQIAQLIPGKDGKQCRERWISNISPSLIKEDWSAEEDNIVLQEVASFGNKWAAISRLLQGRPPNSVKNRYYKLKRKMEKGEYIFLQSGYKAIDDLDSNIYEPVASNFRLALSFHDDPEEIGFNLWPWNRPQLQLNEDNYDSNS